MKPDSAERRLNGILVAGTLAAIVIGAFLFVEWLPGWLRDAGNGYEPDCDSYSFDREEWSSANNTGIEDDSREDQAEALAECESLTGLTRSEVTAMLGPHQKKVLGTGRDKWAFGAGWVNDGYGPGDGQSLYVAFDEAGRVERAKLGYPQ